MRSRLWVLLPALMLAAIALVTSHKEWLQALPRWGNRSISSLPELRARLEEQSRGEAIAARNSIACDRYEDWLEFRSLMLKEIGASYGSPPQGGPTRRWLQWHLALGDCIAIMAGERVEQAPLFSLQSIEGMSREAICVRRKQDDHCRWSGFGK